MKPKSDEKPLIDLDANIPENLTTPTPSRVATIAGDQDEVSDDDDLLSNVKVNYLEPPINVITLSALKEPISKNSKEVLTSREHNGGDADNVSRETHSRKMTHITLKNKITTK